MALSVPLYLACGLNSNDTSSERPPGTTQRQTWTFLAIPISISICGWQYGDNRISLDVNHVLLIGTMTTASTWPTTQVQQPMQEQMNHWVLSYFWGRNSRALEQLLTLGQKSPLSPGHQPQGGYWAALPAPCFSSIPLGLLGECHTGMVFLHNESWNCSLELGKEVTRRTFILHFKTI